MEYRKLGKSGLRISELVLGTMNFGCNVEQKEAYRIMDAALEAGLNYFDTANNYGKAIHKEGISETIIGNWFAAEPAKRQRVILASKVYEPMGDLGANDAAGLSAYKIRRHFESSLQRLQTEHIELYYIHHVDRTINWREVLPVFQSLMTSGKIDYFATSNFAAWNIADIVAEAAQEGMFGPICEQHKYNLMTRQAELEVLPCAKSHGIGVVVWSPLNRGMLSRNARLDSIDDEGVRVQLQRFHALCADLGEHEDTVALAWILQNPMVTAPIIGPRTVEQVYDAVRATEIKLDSTINQELDKIFPGMGGQAPEAYAW